MEKHLNELAKRLKGWKSDPVLFVEELLGATPEPWQAEVLRALPDNYRIAVKSGHGVGKSTLFAWAVLWFLITHAPAKVPCTAPTAHQLKDILWSEIRKWRDKMPDYFKKGIEITSDKVFTTEDNFAVARTARRENPDAFQGFHADNLLFIGDEASGIEEVIFEVAQGALSTKGARILLAGNPTKTSGYFFRCFNVNQNNWYTKTVSCFDSSRVDNAYIESCKAEYGENSNFYRVRVLGEFPASGDMQFIPMDVVERCMAMDDITSHSFPLVMGLDVARHGDDRSVLVARRGRKVLWVEPWRIDDLVTLANKVEEIVKQYPEVKQLSIDTVGMGQGVYDILMRRGCNRILEPVNAGSRPIDDKYFNKRAEMWDKMRQALVEGTDLPKSEELKVDLVGLQYDYNAKQQLVLEKKSDMKKRGLKSPDLADALALTYAHDLSPDVTDEPYMEVSSANTDFRLDDYI